MFIYLEKEVKDGKGFINIPNKRKVGKKGTKQLGETYKKDYNSFQALAKEEQQTEKGKETDPIPEDPDQGSEPGVGKQEKIQNHRRIEKSKIITRITEGEIIMKESEDIEGS
jgi:hypothetical protein